MNVVHHAGCAFDAVALYDGESANAPLIHKYCGNNIPSAVQSSSNKLYLHFTSDGRETDKGFQFTWCK